MVGVSQVFPAAQIGVRPPASVQLSVLRCPARSDRAAVLLRFFAAPELNCRKNARITDSRFSVDWFRYGGNRPEAEKRMSTRRARPIRPGRAYPCRSWGSPRAVSITLQPTSGGARFNRASNILQRGNILPNPLRPRHRCRPPLAIEIIGAGAAATSEILADLPKVSGTPFYMRRSRETARKQKLRRNRPVAGKTGPKTPKHCTNAARVYHFVETKLGGARWVVILSGTGR